MKVNISGFQGEGKTRTARNLAKALHESGKTVRVIDGCDSHELRAGQSKKGKLKCWDVVIRVRTVHV